MGYKKLEKYLLKESVLIASLFSLMLSLGFMAGFSKWYYSLLFFLMLEIMILFFGFVFSGLNADVWHLHHDNRLQLKSRESDYRHFKKSISAYIGGNAATCLFLFLFFQIGMIEKLSKFLVLAFLGAGIFFAYLNQAKKTKAYIKSAFPKN
jgi:hypothetical protein